jgi:hypothetical protein
MNGLVILRSKSARRGEVILGRPAAADANGTDAHRSHLQRCSASDAAAEPPRNQLHAFGGGAKWKKGAPPIPGAGLGAVAAPVLLGNDLGALDTIDAVAERIRTTYCCELCPHRTNAVGEGSTGPHGPGGRGPGPEDATGRPFVGQAGQLLNRSSGY